MSEFIKPVYCTCPDAPDCWECLKACKGRDCRGKSITAVQTGSAKSERKAASSRENGRKGGRPKKIKNE